MTTASTATLQLVPAPRRALRGNAIRRLCRRLGEAWTAALEMTPQDRANAYVARTPVAMIAD
ncbi:hypothetical protein [Mycobacterium asiaticum]|uniref:hypothetical protein n=1 Tax=Mycobacterium asiaticum TaxID=1790 RepID=UPI000A78ECC4|nr:hypothetical protein [Mycobacterium asiaticum]